MRFLSSNRDYGYEDGFSPYLHVFVHHSKEFLQLYGALKPFEMEGVEKLNHSLKMAFYRSTNHGCGSKPISEQVRVKQSRILLIIISIFS